MGSSTLIVQIKNLLMGGDNQVITQPYHIVKILKTEKEIKFEYQ